MLSVKLTKKRSCIRKISQIDENLEKREKKTTKNAP